MQIDDDLRKGLNEQQTLNILWLTLRSLPSILAPNHGVRHKTEEVTSLITDVLRRGQGSCRPESIDRHTLIKFLDNLLNNGFGLRLPQPFDEFGSFVIHRFSSLSAH